MKQNNKKSLIKIFSIVFKIKEKNIKENINFKNQKNWDSLNHVKLIMAVESKFKIKFSPEEHMYLNSFKKIIETVNKLKK
jgi:acyl carrier protein